MPCACKINGMKKKKTAHVSGVSSANMTEAAILAVSVPGGLFIAHMAKEQIIPMLTKDKTAEEAKKIAANVNYATLGLGVLSVIGGAYLKDEEPEIGAGLIGLGTGMATQAAYVMYVNRDGATGKIAAPGGWGGDIKAWNEAARNAMMAGADNASPGLMNAYKKVAGADNASPGLMGPGLIRQPWATAVDEIGKHAKYQVGRGAL